MLISNAYAQAAAPASSGGLMQIVLIVVMLGLMYFLMIRPQQKRAKEHKTLLDSLAKGDEVVLQSGMLGRITKVSDDYVAVEIADKVEVQMQKSAVLVVLPKGTLKSL